MVSHIENKGLLTVAESHILQIRSSLGNGTIIHYYYRPLQEAQLLPSDRALRLVNSNVANYHATMQKLLIRQVLTKPMV